MNLLPTPKNQHSQYRAFTSLEGMLIMEGGWGGGGLLSALKPTPLL